MGLEGWLYVRMRRRERGCDSFFLKKKAQGGSDF